jgi:aryl-alcohol dehydrogenase-like predicted oxidoreductase
MRRIICHVGHVPVSAIGFGCAAIGSWLSAKEGRRALDRAFDAGVTWYDVAPSYGDGAAEAIVGEFLAARSGAANICTKVGIVAVSTGWKAALRPGARRIVNHWPALRKFARHVKTIECVPLTRAVVTESVERSLLRLRVERIDLLMAHDPAATDLTGDEVAHAFGAVLESGKVGAVGVAGDLEAAAAGASRPELFSVLQIDNSPFSPSLQDPRLAGWRGSPGRLAIAHGALNVVGALPTLKAMLAADDETRRLLRNSGYDPAAPEAAAEALIDYALATNSDGVCLFSAAKPRHLASLVARADAVRERSEMLALGCALAARLPALKA